MKEKILKDLKKVKIDNILQLSKDINLVDSKSILDVKVGDENTIIVIDLVPLNIKKDQALIVKELIEKKLKKPFIKNKKINVIFTSDQKIKESPEKPVSKTTNNTQEKSDIEPIKNVKNIIVVASGKGGVGKSTVAVNLALSLKRIGRNVGLVDGDVYGPSIGHMMNLKGKPEFKDNLMVPIKSYGLNCVSISSIVDKDQALVWRGPMITKTLNQLMRGVNWGYEDKDVDYLIVDLPPGTGDVHLSMCQQFPISGAVIVSTSSDVAVIDAIKALDMFDKLSIPVLGVVQNMSYLENKDGEKTYLFGKDKVKELAKDKKLSFLGDIPIDESIRSGGDEKNPILNSDPSSKSAFAFGRIAENILDEIIT